MKVRYIKSATVVIEHQGVKVLCDPWLTDGIYYGAWYHWPILKFKPEDFHDVDYIYISHVHPDHCDVKTLASFPKHIPILISDFHEKFLLKTLSKLGFTDIREVPNRGTVQLASDFSIEIIAGDDCNQARFSKIYGHNVPVCDKSFNIDSLAIFKGGDKVVVNSNDVPIALIFDSFPYIKSKYGEIHMLLVSYAGAGPFPQAYMLPEDEKLNLAVHAAYSFISGTMGYIQCLDPKYYMPYAGQYTLGGKSHNLNSYKGTLELDELILDLVPFIGRRSKAEMVLLDSGEHFDLDSGQASAPFSPTDFIARSKYIKDVLSKKPFDYETSEYDQKDLLPRLKEARSTLWQKQGFYKYFTDFSVYIDAGDGKIYDIDFKSPEIKIADEVDTNRPFFSARIDPRLLDWILDRKANWNNAEIGSHIQLFDFIPAEEAAKKSYYPMPHFLMAYFQRPFQTISPKVEGELVGAKR